MYCITNILQYIILHLIIFDYNTNYINIIQLIFNIDYQ